MSDASVATRSGGIGFLGMLTILFIGLKLTGYIDWSWFLVLAPAFLPIIILLSSAAFLLIVMGLAMMAAAFIALYERVKDR